MAEQRVKRTNCNCMEEVTLRSWQPPITLHIACNKSERINNNEAEAYIAGRWNFTNRSESLSGHSPQQDGTRGALPREYYESVNLSSYAVWSYRTPIAWWLDMPARTAGEQAIAQWLDGAEEGHWVIPAVRYSSTTNKHQSLLWRLLDGTEYQATSHRKFKRVLCGGDYR